MEPLLGGAYSPLVNLCVCHYIAGDEPVRHRPVRACAQGCAPGRSVRPQHRLSARVGDRSLRLALRLLHVRTPNLPAQGRGAEPGRAGPAVLGLYRAWHAQAAPDRRRAPGAARLYGAGPRPVAPSEERRPAGADPHHQRHAPDGIRRAPGPGGRQAPERVGRQPGS